MLSFNRWLLYRYFNRTMHCMCFAMLLIDKEFEYSFYYSLLVLYNMVKTEHIFAERKRSENFELWRTFASSVLGMSKNELHFFKSGAIICVLCLLEELKSISFIYENYWFFFKFFYIVHRLNEDKHIIIVAIDCWMSKFYSTLVVVVVVSCHSRWRYQRDQDNKVKDFCSFV